MANNLQSQQSKIYEGLEHGDLHRLVDPHFYIDEYRSKMGDDADIMVLSFKVDGKSAANDLMQFIERGYEFVQDADLSSGEDSKGKWIVFVEMERSHKAPKQIVKLVDDILNLTKQDIDEWSFNYHEDDTDYPATEEAIEKAVPLSPKLYRDRFGDKELDKLKETARVPFTKKAPNNHYTDMLRTAAGLK